MTEPLFLSRHCLYDCQQLQPVLDRMATLALRLLADAPDPRLVGILRRGEPLAQLLQQRIQTRSGLTIPVSGLKVKRYADDLSLLHPDTELTASADIAAIDFRTARVLLVDDVLYQGHSLLRSVSYLAARGCREIHTAVLVDRQIRQVPVTADIVGLVLQIAPSDVIECNVPPYEPELRIDLCSRSTVVR